MKIQVRRGVFETNSSSTHSLTMCMKEDYDKWKAGEVYLNDSWSIKTEGQFATKEEAIKAIEQYTKETYEEDEIDEKLRDWSFKSYDDWCDNYELESFYDTFKTKTGEEIVAFGEYGYDG